VDLTAGSARDIGISSIRANFGRVVIPAEQRWLFWDVDPNELELERDRRYLLGRLLERGRLDDVRWAVGVYGIEGIRDFFEAGGHPELSPRTIALWTAFFDERREPWPRSTTWRQTNAAPWIA
jgi:hypothetical protein